MTKRKKSNLDQSNKKEIIKIIALIIIILLMLVTSITHFTNLDFSDEYVRRDFDYTLTKVWIPLSLDIIFYIVLIVFILKTKPKEKCTKNLKNAKDWNNYTAKK